MAVVVCGGVGVQERSVFEGGRKSSKETGDEVILWAPLAAAISLASECPHGPSVVYSVLMGPSAAYSVVYVVNVQFSVSSYTVNDKSSGPRA